MIFEESLEGKTISKKNQALIKVRILNLREEKKKYENRIVHGPQNEGENSKLNNIPNQTLTSNGGRGTLTRAVERSLPTLASPSCEEERQKKNWTSTCVFHGQR